MDRMTAQTAPSGIPTEELPTGRGGPAAALRTAWLCLAEARPQVQAVFLLRFAVGLAVTGPGALAGPVTGALAWWCAVVCAYLLNGAMDVAEDRANGSRRPIARGALPVRTATRVTVALAAAALALAAAVEPEVAGWTGAFLVLGWAYSAPPVAAKRWSVPCAVVVFGLGWTSYAAGAAAAGDGWLPRTGLVFGTAMSAWMALVGAMVKDLSDAGGDAVGGRRTLAALRGPGAARRAAVLGATLVGTAGPAVALAWSPLALAGTVPLAVGAGWVVVECLRLGRTDSAGEGSRHARRGAYRAFMATQYVANLAMLTALLAVWVVR